MNAKAPTATEIHKRLFDRPRDPRSPAYKAGALAAIRLNLDGVDLGLPYAPGTAEHDAWLAGYAEGRDACLFAEPTASG